MRLGMQCGRLLPEGAACGEDDDGAVGVLEEVGIVIRRIGADDPFLRRPRISASPEFELHPRRDVPHALVFGCGERGGVVEVHGLRVGVVDLQRPFAVGRLAELPDDRSAECGKKLLGDVQLDVANQVVDELPDLLSAQAFLLRISVPGIAKVGSIEGQVDVLREAADGIEGLGERCATLENEGGCVLGLFEQAAQGPADPEVLFDDRVREAPSRAGFPEQGGTVSGG
jgi:hypothetical protein